MKKTEIPQEIRYKLHNALSSLTHHRLESMDEDAFNLIVSISNKSDSYKELTLSVQKDLLAFNTREIDKFIDEFMAFDRLIDESINNAINVRTSLLRALENTDKGIMNKVIHLLEITSYPIEDTIYRKFDYFDIKVEALMNTKYIFINSHGELVATNLKPHLSLEAYGGWFIPYTYEGQSEYTRIIGKCKGAKHNIERYYPMSLLQVAFG